MLRSLPYSPLPEPLAAFRSTGNSAPYNLQHPSMLWNSRQNDIRCQAAQLRNGGLRRRSSTGTIETIEGPVRPQYFGVELAPVISRYPWRQAWIQTAVRPEAGVPSFEVRPITAAGAPCFAPVITMVHLLQQIIFLLAPRLQHWSVSFVPKCTLLLQKSAPVDELQSYVQ